MRGILYGISCGALCLAIASAQQPPPATTGQPAITFRAEVDYVDVDAVVTDQRGNFVSDLTQQDFEIFEDGRPQNVALFSRVDLPLEHRDPLLFDGRRVSSDIATNQEALAGRLYVIVLDDVNTSFYRTAAVRQMARRFVDVYFSASDTAAVVYTSGRADASQEFTSDRALLTSAIDKFEGRKLRSAALDAVDAYFRQEEIRAAEAARNPNDPGNTANQGSMLDRSINPYVRRDAYSNRVIDSQDPERGSRALRVLESLQDLSDFMSIVRGRRKAMLFFSEGIDYDTTDIFGAHSATQVTRAIQDAITAAARGNVSIFGIDPRGLAGISPDIAGDLGSPSTGDPTAVAMNVAAFRAEMLLAQDSLRTLSEETGGFATVSANDAASAFERIVRANSQYYVLGYYPPSHPRDGRFHTIDVRVKRPGVRVIARRGYASPRGATPEERSRAERERMAREAKRGGADATSTELRAALNSPMQQPGVTMLLQAAPFRGSGSEHPVALAIEVDARAFRFESRNDSAEFADTIELSLFSVNQQGKPLRGERREVELTLRPATHQQVRQVGMRINERIALSPGRYQLRVGVRERGTGALGTVFSDLEVPDFSRTALSMSGILLTAASSRLVPTLIADKQPPSDRLPGAVTSRRAFAQGDDLSLYLEVYDNAHSEAHTITIATRLVGDDGRAVFTSQETRREEGRRNAGTTTIGVAKQVPLKDVAPGRYLLQAEAQSNARDTRPVTRETIITVSR